MASLRTAPGMRERSPGVWELVVEAGRDPVTGKRRQASRLFRGNLRDAKKARAALLVEVSKGRHSGSRATLDDLFAEWIIELRRKGRSPNTVHGYELVYKRNIQPTLGTMQVTKVTTKTLTDLYGAHQKRGLAGRSVYQVHACLSSMFTRRAVGVAQSNPGRGGPPHPNRATWRPTSRGDERQAEGPEAGNSRENGERHCASVPPTNGVPSSESRQGTPWPVPNTMPPERPYKQSPKKP